MVTPIDEPAVASEDEAPAVRRLDQMLTNGSGAAPALLGPAGEDVRLPPTVYALLRRAVHELARGRAVAVVPYQVELTTQQAADLLNVSRPFLIDRVLEAGALPFRRVGKHRRLQLTDVLAYKRDRDRQRGEALRRMLRDAEEDRLYDMANPFAIEPVAGDDGADPSTAAG